jgi:hypothetical protein
MRSVIVALCLSTALAAADERATATLPLDEVLKLHQNAAKDPPAEPPPLAASVDRLTLKARLLGDAVHLQAHFEVTALRNGWVELPLLRLGNALSIATLPDIEDATLAVRAGRLVFVTNKPAGYAFDVTFVGAPKQGGRVQTFEIGYDAATLAVLHVDYDENLFALVGGGGSKESDGVVLYPRDNRFAIAWQTLRPGALSQKAVKRPPIEPVIARAHASVVSTLEGGALVRLLYELRCEGAQRLSVQIPEEQKLDKVFLNGAAIPFTLDGQTLRLEVAPARAGDASGQLELVLAAPMGPYNLSGRLRFVAPRASWPITEMFVQLHLPGVFDYARVGGSMESVSDAPEVAFTHQVPLPGKELRFHQFLIAAGAPLVLVKYDVDLSTSYYR